MLKNLCSIFRRFLLILSFTFALINNLSFAAETNADEMMNQAGEYYRKAEYDKAINLYLQLINSGYEGTTLFYNLGNSYYRIGKLGFAILNYERALKISPSDEDVRHNLAFAYLGTIDRIQPLPEFILFEWWESLLAAFTVNGWTYLTYFFFILFLSLVAVYFFARTILQQKLILFSGLGMLIVFLLSLSLLIVKVNRETTLKRGIVVTQSVTVKTSPDQKSTDAFVIHEGLKVNLEDKLDDWVKIRLVDGKVGWVEKDFVAQI